MNVDTVKLKAYLDRLDAEANERDKHSGQIRDIVKSAKGDGFDGKALRKVFVRRRMDADKRQHDDDLLDIYEHALGAKGRALAAIASGVPSGEAAKTNGIHRATVARARHVAKQVDNATPHDPETGEVHGEDDQPGAAEVSGRTDEGAQGGGGAARLCSGDELPSGQVGPASDAAGGAERPELGAGRPAKSTDPVRVVAEPDTTLPAFLDRRPKQDAEASVSPERSEAVHA